MVFEIPQLDSEQVKSGKINSENPVKVDSEKPIGNEPSKNSALERPKFNYSMKGYEYQKDELFLKYKSKDGDTLELSYSSESLKAYSVEASSDNVSNGNGFQDIFSKIDDFIESQNRQLLDMMFKILNGKENGETSDVTGAGEGELNIPEYWNAENTSQRIVDFATSFYDVAGMEGSEYGEMMMNAVKKGFEEANEILGNLPGATGELVKETQKLTLEKLDNWIAQHSNMAMAA